MECKGAIDIQKINLVTMEFMLYILSRDLLSCNQPGLCRSKNKP